MCPHHGDCLEGLAAGPAIIARWGKSLSEMPDDHEAHDIVACYIAQLCHTLFATCAIDRIILGGGVMKTSGLIAAVRTATRELDAGYLPGGENHKIVRPALGDDSGVIGALILAQASLP